MTALALCGLLVTAVLGVIAWSIIGERDMAKEDARYWRALYEKEAESRHRLIMSLADKPPHTKDK